MNFSNQLKKIEPQIKQILTDFPETRNSDKALWFTYNVEFCGLGKFETLEDFRRWLMSETVPAFESISRARRKVQERNPLLRGDTYQQRLFEQERVREWSKS